MVRVMHDFVNTNKKSYFFTKATLTNRWVVQFCCRTFVSKPAFHISAVVCGERTMEAATMLKSTTIFTDQTVQLHVVAEDELHAELKNIFTQWQTVQSGQVQFKLYSLQFPSGENSEEWKQLFKPCAAQRLFLVVSRISEFFYQTLIRH